MPFEGNGIAKGRSLRGPALAVALLLCASPLRGGQEKALALYGEANALFRSGDFVRAMTAYRLALRAGPAEPWLKAWIRIRMAWCYEKRRKPRAARQEYDFVKKFVPTVEDPYEEKLQKALMYAKHPEAARMEWAEEAFLKKARRKNRKEEWEGLHEICKTFLEAYPGAQPEARARALIWMGVSLSRRDQKEKAIEVTEAALGFDNVLQANALYNMGVYQSSLGRHGEALKSFRRILSESPGYAYAPSVSYSMGMTLEKLGRIDEAKKMYRKIAADRDARCFWDPSRPLAPLARKRLLKMGGGG